MPLRLVRAFTLIVALAATSATHAAPIAQPAAPTITGAWVLNPALTQRPDEIGFSQDWARAQGSGAEGGGRSGGSGRRGSGSGDGARGVPAISRESADDSTRVQQLTGEARTPPSRLTIIPKDTAISIADDQGHARTFHPDGHLEELTIGTVALPTTARWDGANLVVVYDVETGRQLRYTYTPSADPTRLQVNIRFLERGREGDEVRLTYEPLGAHERAILSGVPASPAAPSASAPTSPGAAGAAAPSARPPVLPPGSELRGLTTIGTVVEDLSAQGKACGLDQEKIKTSIARILADAGFKTERFGNEDTYVLLSVVTSRLPDGTCVSRYDASLVTQADATFPYLKGLVAVQVQLLHEGGIAGGSPAAHASAVMDAFVKSANSFVSQIRAANKSVGAL
jgi:hypothetical protein